jgi:hypothetical protein
VVGSWWRARRNAWTNDLDASVEWRRIDQVVVVGTRSAAGVAPRSLIHERVRKGQARLPRHVFVELLDMVRSGQRRTGSITLPATPPQRGGSLAV